MWLSSRVLTLAGFAVLTGLLVLIYVPRIETGYVVPLDFSEVDRALTFDRDDPRRLWTEPHAGFGFRPVTQWVHLMTAVAGDGSASVFLIRNLMSHLANAVLVTILASLLLRSSLRGLIVGFFFALHPLAVSMVGVPVYHPYGVSVYLVAGIAFTLAIESHVSGRRWLLGLVAVLSSIAPWMTENGLWLLTPASGAALWFLIRKCAGWWITLIPWLSAVSYLAVRNRVVNIADQVTVVQETGTYGLRSISGLISNLLVYQVGAALPVDYLLGMDPRVESLSRTDLLGAQGNNFMVVAAVVGSLALALLAYVALVRSLMRSANRRLAVVGLLMILAFWLSAALKLVFAASTEMYVYEGSPWWLIGVAAITFASTDSLPPRSRRRTHFVLAIPATLILVGFAYSTSVRIDILNEKAMLLQAPANLVRQVAADSEDDRLSVAVVVDCEVPFGFSAFGLNRGSAILSTGYARLYFRDLADRVHVFRAGQLDANVLEAFGEHVVYVDDELAARLSPSAAAESNERCWRSHAMAGTR